MTQAAYARRRGVHPVAVGRAIKAGRLNACVVRDATGRPLGISDPDLADREWAANSDYTDAPHHNPGALPVVAPVVQPADPELADQSVAGAAGRSKHWEAEMRKLKFHEAAGELVPVKDVDHRLVTVFTHCKTRLLAIPSRARQALPHLSLADVGTLENLIREALTDLSEAKA